MERPSEASLVAPEPEAVNKVTTKEVDFYKNPTILSRLILNQKYESALRRVKSYPSEASTWVCAKRNPFKGSCMLLMQQAAQQESSFLSVESAASSSRSLVSHRSTKSMIRKGAINLEYSMRQLPIHVACSNLSRTSKDHKLRLALENFISHLAVTYPEGCSEVDHEGKLPLHEAISCHAKPSTIAILLMASPKSIHERDKYGRTPLDINLFRDGENKDHIKALLLRGALFWEQAKTEALAKLKSSKHLKDTTKIKDGHRSLLASNAATSPAKRGDKSNIVEPVTWVKLEKRAIHLEGLLADSYEKHYEAHALIEELRREKHHLQDEIERLESLHNDAESAQVHLLLKENEILHLQVQALQQAHFSTGQSGDASNVSLPDEIVNFLEDQNSQLQQQVDQLTMSNQDSMIKLQRLQMVMESVGESEDENSNYARLLETLKSNSHYATERFLSKKVLELEGLLAEAEAVADNEIAQTRQENSRLIQENQLLHSKVPGQTLQRVSPSSANTMWLSPAPEHSIFETDDLDHIFYQAAAMYGSGPKGMTFKPTASQTEKVVFCQPPKAPIQRSKNARSSFSSRALTMSNKLQPPERSAPHLEASGKKKHVNKTCSEGDVCANLPRSSSAMDVDLISVSEAQEMLKNDCSHRAEEQKSCFLNW